MASKKWRKLIADVYEKLPEQEGYATKPKFCPGVSDSELRVAEGRLGVELPKQHRSLLLETNGVMGMMSVDGGKWHDSGWLLWPLDQIVEENLRIRSDDDNRKMYMPLDCFLFFADAGNGDLFGYSIVNGEIRCPDVFAWGHEDDTRPNIAPSLAQFVEGWMDGTIKL
jgi:hypothetical protein